MSARGLALVCVGFDAETPALTKAAVALARKAKLDLRFVYVDEGLFEPWVADMPLYQFSGAVIYETQQKIREQHERNLKELVTSLPADIKASFELLTGDVAAAIGNDAIKHRANLVMTAYNLDKNAADAPAGYAFAVRLMADAPLPVLVMNRRRPLDLDRAEFSILVGDDLQPSCEEAVRKAFELATFVAKSGGRCRVRHLHIHGDFREALRDRWQDLQAKHPFLFGDKVPEEVLLAEYRGRIERLRSRGGSFHEAADKAGVVTEPDVVSGQVHSQIDNAIADVKPDLVVFGRHKTLKVRPYLIGRNGLNVMLKIGLPILVVPPRDQLYAPMPFPGSVPSA